MLSLCHRPSIIPLILSTDSSSTPISIAVANSPHQFPLYRSFYRLIPNGGTHELLLLSIIPLILSTDYESWISWHGPQNTLHPTSHLPLYRSFYRLITGRDEQLLSPSIIPLILSTDYSRPLWSKEENTVHKFIANVTFHYTAHPIDWLQLHTQKLIPHLQTLTQTPMDPYGG